MGVIGTIILIAVGLVILYGFLIFLRGLFMEMDKDESSRPFGLFILVFVIILFIAIYLWGD